LSRERLCRQTSVIRREKPNGHAQKQRAYTPNELCRRHGAQVYRGGLLRAVGGAEFSHSRPRPSTSGSNVSFLFRLPSFLSCVEGVVVLARTDRPTPLISSRPLPPSALAFLFFCSHSHNTGAQIPPRSGVSAGNLSPHSPQTAGASSNFLLSSGQNQSFSTPFRPYPPGRDPLIDTKTCQFRRIGHRLTTGDGPGQKQHPLGRLRQESERCQHKCLPCCAFYPAQTPFLI